MPNYIVLFNFTDQGIRGIRELPNLTAQADQRLAAAGIKVQRFFTLGQYDVVAVIESPSDEAVTVSLLVGASQGLFRTTTLKAFTQEEFFQIVNRMPPAPPS